jgi:hypothetical protein
MNSWQYAATSDAKVIANWFRGFYKGYGVGVATGEESHIWVLDIDTGPDKPGEASLEALVAEHGPLPATVEAVTGSGGRHLYFTWPTGQRVVTRRDTKATSSPLPAGIDVRGEGGQVLAPPTIHPNGTTYTWREGHSPWDREVADAPDWLLDIVCEQPAPPTSTPIAEPTTPLSGDDSIAGWFDQTEHWDSLLLRDGWTPLAAQGDQQYWVRPGKEIRDGHSAVLHLPDGPFVIFSTDGGLARYALPEARVASGDGWSYSKFGYLAASRHGGDRSEAARRLREVRTERERHTTAAVAADGRADTDEAPPSSWRRVDLSDILAGDYAPVEPALLLRTDNQPILYMGRVNGLFGESGAGKSWVGLLASAERVMAGEQVIYIDLEDHPPNIVARLRGIGVTVEAIAEHFIYVQPEGPATEADIAAIDAMCIDAALVVIDSLGEATALHGVEENHGDQYAMWNVRFARHWARIGPAVLTLDHIPKSEDAPTLFAVGTQRKKAAIDGILLRVDQVEAFDRTKAGRVKLTCAKDRNGKFHRGQMVAELIVTPSEDRVELRLEAPAGYSLSGEVNRPTVLMERVSRWLEINGTSSAREIVTSVEGKDKYLTKAIEVLVAEGHLDKAVRTARGGGFEYSVRTSFRDDSDTVKPVENPELRPAANRGQLRPGAALNPSTEPRPAFITEGGRAAVTGTSTDEPRPEATEAWEGPF